jgi:hypothetical protein
MEHTETGIEPDRLGCDVSLGFEELVKVVQEGIERVGGVPGRTGIQSPPPAFEAEPVVRDAESVLADEGDPDP